jgi:hypothetical protein
MKRLMMLGCTLLVACGSKPPPKAEEPVKEEAASHRPAGPTPQVSQELGSIDPRKVEQTLANLVSGPLETCHKQGRDRIEFLTGDVKLFLRIDGNGKLKYGYFEDSTLGDRETEKCILGTLSNASWPKPEGGEAEVRSGFGWGPGGEREPTSWPSDKITLALVEAKDVRKDVDKCKDGVKADFSVTAYVEMGDSGDKPGDKHEKPTPKRGKKGNNNKAMGGRFKAIGVSAKSKEGAEKIDCIVEALKPLDLPSPGSYAAKVTFSL